MFSTAKLKSLMAGATLLVVVVAPGGAQAKDYSGNGGNFLAQILSEVLGGSAYRSQSVHQKSYQNDGHGARDVGRHDGYRGGYQGGYRAQKILPIGKLARRVHRDTGGRVTKAVLSDNGRFYKLEGIGRRGRFVSAKADAYTGEVYNVRRQRRGHRADHAHGYDALPIPKVLRKLRAKGFHDFDRVVLKEDRGLYRVRGLNKRGKPVVVKVHAYDGHILKVKRARNYNRSRFARY